LIALPGNVQRRGRNYVPTFTPDVYFWVKLRRRVPDLVIIRISKIAMKAFPGLDAKRVAQHVGPDGRGKGWHLFNVVHVHHHKVGAASRFDTDIGCRIDLAPEKDF